MADINITDELVDAIAENYPRGGLTVELAEEVRRLRAAGDALLRAIEQLPIKRFDEGLAVINAMHDWEEARRG